MKDNCTGNYSSGKKEKRKYWGQRVGGDQESLHRGIA